MTVWQHTRRGRIEGELLRQDDTWMHIRLTADSPRASALHPGHGPVDKAGETITVRAAHVTEITPRPTLAQLLAFAAHHPGPHTSNTDMAIRRDLGITPARYIQLLNAAINTPEALHHDPATTNRLHRENQAAAAARARRLHP